MWRSNVLRLRTCSSTFEIQHVKKRWHSGNADTPVSTAEFLKALEDAHPRPQYWKAGLERWPIGGKLDLGRRVKNLTGTRPCGQRWG
jgi:hypothetical protein